MGRRERDLLERLDVLERVVEGLVADVKAIKAAAARASRAAKAAADPGDQER